MIGPFEWDETKRERNLRDHEVDFVDMPPLFEGEILESVDDPLRLRRNKNPVPGRNGRPGLCRNLHVAR
jgi:uncharacterized DUF497 family protein